MRITPIDPEGTVTVVDVRDGFDPAKHTDGDIPRLELRRKNMRSSFQN